MSQGNLSLSGYFLGICVAILVFLIREFIGHVWSGRLFRMRLVSDMKLLIENHWEHLPILSEQVGKLTSALETIRTVGEVIVELAPVWSNEFNLIEDLYKNSSQLNTDAYKETVCFYDVVGRLSEERKTYNERLCQLISGRQAATESLVFQFLLRCLEDMRDDYYELIKRGCNALLLIAQKHRFSKLNINAAYYGRRLKEVSQQHLLRG